MTLKPIFIGVALAATLSCAPAFASGEAHVKDVKFSFEGPFGKFDQAQLQRGFQIYKEICSACHGLKYVAFRDLTEEGGPGFSKEQAKAIAKDFEVADEDGDPGDTRPAKLSDKFPAVTSAGAPDLSLMTKAREAFHDGVGVTQLFRGSGGPEYVYSILTGFTGKEKEQTGSTFYGNHAFSTGWIRMPPPLSDDAVQYQDGTRTNKKQLAKDVAAFLTWTAEPKMMERKSAGVRNIFFLVIFAILLYLSNKKIWSKIKRKDA